jgi:nicotinic acid mononucleotide adenylyltransferase
MKPVAITFGRMNPPTIGHQKLVDHLHSTAKKHGADAEVHLSHTQDRKKNPLSHAQKVGLARKAFGDSVKSGPHKTIIDVMKHLHKQGRKEVHVVVGGDRHKEMHELLHRYNGKEYHFDKIHVHSAGERDPDAEGAEGMSASKMREHAKNNNHEGFKSGLPEKLRSSAHRVMKMVRTGMGHVEEYDMFGGGTSAFTPADRVPPESALSLQREDDPDGDDEPKSSEAIGTHDELNPSLFADDRIMPEVRIQLRKIADSFIRFVGVPLDVKDIVFTGSNASYHYTQHSDIDLHVVVKLKGGASMRAYMRQLFDAKKSLWNQTHKIHIRGFEVELYIEPTEEPAVSSGVYSIMNDKWVKHPTNEKPSMDDVSVRSKYRQYKDEIDTAVRSNDATEIESLLAELRQMRSSGLAKGGEYSVENIVYKLLRARGDLQRLWSARADLGDKELSLEGHKYFAGLGKGTAAARAAQFNRQTKMSDSDPSAYKSAPGDNKKTKTSVHTLKYRKQFGDNYNANDVQFNPPELPVRYSYLSASYNKKFEEFSEAAGYRNLFKNVVPFQLDPTVQPLGHAVPTSRYDLESADMPSKLVADKQRREKETLDRKHDREREAMKVQDLRKKMMQRSEEVERIAEATKDGNASWRVPAHVKKHLEDKHGRAQSIHVSSDGSKITHSVRHLDDDGMDHYETRTHEYNGKDPVKDRKVGKLIKHVKPKISVEEAADQGLAKKAEKSGIPVGILRQVYNRGMAAWKTGHRPGANQQQWAYARVNSFITKGKGTWGGADKDLASRVRKESVNEAFGQIVRAADFEYKKEKLPDGRIVYRKVHKRVRVEGDPNPRHRETGTDSVVSIYKKDTPGQNESKQDMRYLAPVPWETQEAKDPGKSPQTYKDVRKALAGIREQKELSEDFTPGIMDAPTAQQLGIRAQFGYANHPSVEEEDDAGCGCGGNCQCDDVEEGLEITEAEYQGRKVTLNKPFRTPGGPKKSAVYTTNGAGKVVIVRFGDPNMTIKKNIPGRRSNFRARHNCDNPGPRWMPRYWSCKAW